jgi:phage shock protein C
MPAKRIYRNTRAKVVAGVCAGIADYFDVDVAWIRLAFVLSVFASGFGLLAYVVAWMVFPKEERIARTPDLPGAPPNEAPANEAPAPVAAGRSRGQVAVGSRNAIGILLVLLGVLFFMDRNFWWFRFDAFWPVILIALGLYLVLRPLSHSEVPEVHGAGPVATSPGAPLSDTSSNVSSQG